MFHIKSGDWKWYFPDKQASFTPPANPAELLEAAVIIKDYAGTKVFRWNGLFFKWEKYAPGNLFERLKRYFSPRAAREFATLSRLQRCGLVVTPPVAFAVSNNANILVTREVSGAQSVLEYICLKYEKNEALSPDFLSSWGRFFGNFINSGFYFPDFHCGNVLFIESEHRFVLVDLKGVRKPWSIRPKQKERMIFRQLKDVMEFFSTEELKLVLKSAGVAENEEQFLQFLQLYASMADELLKRRLHSFGINYLWVAPFRKKLYFPITVHHKLPENVIDEIWQNDFALQFHGIPHLHLQERNNNDIITEKGFTLTSANEEAALRKRLAIAGFDPDNFGYCLNAGNKTVVCHKKLIE